MIEEAYISYEVAKLMKNKGFDFGLVRGQKCTHQMAMRWLREKDLAVVINPTWIEGDMRNPTMWRWEVIGLDKIGRDHSSTIHEAVYEEAVEAALKYVLENLI